MTDDIWKSGAVVLRIQTSHVPKAGGWIASVDKFHILASGDTAGQSVRNAKAAALVELADLIKDADAPVDSVTFEVLR